MPLPTGLGQQFALIQYVLGLLIYMSVKTSNKIQLLLMRFVLKINT